jgi:3-oxoacyl-[acyl-carrier protein] reductase
MNAHELEGRVALVTGASRNIGRAIAEELAAGGAHVVVNALKSKEAAEAVAAGIRERGGTAEAHLADVTDPDAVAAMVAHVVQRHGRIDILVNNAVTHRDSQFLESTYEDWRRTLTVTLDGAYLCTRNAVPEMIRTGGGAIVNIGGLAGHMYMYDRVPVSAAKAGLAGMTRALAGDLARSSITVNCIVPGPTNTVRAKPSRQDPQKIPVPRLAEPAEIAAMARLLCGPRGRYTTGQCIHINGGLYMS